MSHEKPLEVFAKPKQRHVGETFLAHARLFDGDERIEATAMPDGVLIGCIWFPDLEVAAERLHSAFPGEWLWSEPLIQFRRETKNYGGRLREVTLEPFLLVEVTTPADFVGDVIGDLSSRRALITGQGDAEGLMVISAEAPLAGLESYLVDLSNLTAEKGKATAKFLNYQQRPFYLDPPPDEPMSAALRA